MKQIMQVMGFLGVFTFLLSVGEAAPNAKLKGSVKIDGSSTVGPISEAVAEEFGKEFPRVRVTVGISGTGGGFKKFANAETDINDASRRIKDKEKLRAQEKGVKYVELPVAYDGISVVVNPKNTWVKSLTVQELKRIWQPGSTVKTWKNIRPSWPDRPIKLYGPGTDSGTFDYFTKAINGKSGAARADFSKSEDDNMLVRGIAGDRDSLGFFGFAYYAENKDKLRLVSIDSGEGPIAPSLMTINNGSYKPLSRPIFIYVGQKASHRPAVHEFVQFYLQKAGSLVQQVGYVPLSEKDYKKELVKYKKFALKGR